MSEYPSDWNLVPIREIISESRIDPELDDPSKRISVRLHCEGVEKRSERATDQAGATRYYKRLAGQFIYGKQNLHKGAVGIVPNELHGFCSSQDIPAFDITQSVDPNWFLHLFRQRSFYESLESIATGTGSKRIQPSELGEKEIAVPPLPEQKKIAEILSGIEKAISKLLEAIAKTETALIGVFANLDLIASSGKTSTLGEVIRVQNGYAFQSSIFSEDPADIPLVRISNISGGVVDISKSKRIPRGLAPSDDYKVNSGDILIAMSGATTGKIGIYQGDAFCLLNQRVGKFVFRSGNDSATYATQLLLSGFLESRILAKAAGGAQPNISSKGIEDIEIPFPDTADQEKYGSAIKELLRVNCRRRIVVEKYQHLKASISSDLLSGRNRVSV